MFQEMFSKTDFRVTSKALGKEWYLEAPDGTRSLWIHQLTSNDAEVCSL